MRRRALAVCVLVPWLGCSAGRSGGQTGVGSGGRADAAVIDPDGGVPGDPQSCDEAASSRSYIGCDYWPTVVANNVWAIFDFAVVVANGGSDPAGVTVTGPNGVHSTTIVQPNQLEKIYLPWVADLKGPESTNCGFSAPLAASVSHPKGAYHLVSTRPVTVYQFNALEYKGVGGGEGKDWSSCPGATPCNLNNNMPIGCFSFSNDASLLLPSTAMTGNYRITGQRGMGDPVAPGGIGPYIAITGTADGTQVTLKLAQTAQVVAGNNIVATPAGGVATFQLDAGDVVEVLGGTNSSADLSGSLLKATHPVQVIAGVPCFQNPAGVAACDHIEESVFPAETLGRDYVVTVPTGPHGSPVGHTVRLYGNVDGTHLTFEPSTALPGAPSTISAGQVIELGTVTTDFEVKGDHEFAVGSFMLGGSLVDSSAPIQQREGDPSQSLSVAVEQFRTKYVFLAPDDYDSNYADVVAPVGTSLMLDGQPVTAPLVPVGASGFGVARVKLVTHSDGTHVLEGSSPIGIQVLGYGLYTSYQYPGGLDLHVIAAPPIG